MGISADRNSTTNCNCNIYSKVHKDCFFWNDYDIVYAQHIQYTIPLFCCSGNVLSGKLGSCNVVCVSCDNEYEIIKQEVKQ